MKISSDPAKKQDYTTQAPQSEASAAAKPYATTQAQDEANWKGQQASEKSTAAFSSEKKREDDANAIARQNHWEKYRVLFDPVWADAARCQKQNELGIVLFQLVARELSKYVAHMAAGGSAAVDYRFLRMGIGGVFLFIQPVASVILLIVAMVAGIWQIIAQILFAKRFNQCYMKHVEQKLANHDHSLDPSGGRVVVSYLITSRHWLPSLLPFCLRSCWAVR